MAGEALVRIGLGLAGLLGAAWAATAAAGDARGFGDWFAACEGNRCSVTQETDLVQIEVLFEAGQDPRIFLHVARESRAGNPITVRLEDGEHAHLKVNRCQDTHCSGEIAFAKLSPKLIAEIKNSTGAMIAYQVQGVIVIAPVSFEGYAEASAFAREKTTP